MEDVQHSEIQEKYRRRRKSFIRYSMIISAGYAITQIGSLIAKELHMSSISYGAIAFAAGSSIGFTLLITLIVALKKELPDRFIFPVITLQFGIWLVLYMCWVYFLCEARILALFFAYMPLIFLITNSNLAKSFAITMGVTVIQIGVSFYAINVAGQPGSFTEVVFYTSWFFPSALYIAYVAGIFHRQRGELRVAKKNAEKARDALWGEMELAKKIQTVLLPERPSLEGFEVAAYMAPADEVGGDYYDVIHVEGKDWIVIGDVSGHGVPAGLVMMMAQTAIKSIVKKFPSIPPVELLSIINGIIADNIKRLGGMKYMSLTVLAMHEHGEFFFSGLHQDIMLYRAATRGVDITETRGMWIGIVEDVEGMMEEDRLKLAPGDVMMLYTDGITEAVGSDGAMFSEERLAALLQEHGEKAPVAIKEAIIENIRGYSVRDDITLVIVKRLE